MKTIIFILLISPLSIFLSAQEKVKKVNNDELIGNYGLEINGQTQISIIKEVGNYYLKFPGSSSKNIMSNISKADCLRILGSNWNSKFISGLHAGAFFVFKVKKGSVVKGITVNSGYFGALPAAGQIWKLK